MKFFKFLTLLLIAGLIALAPLKVNAQATFTAKDASGSTQTFKSFNCSSTICSISVPADITGAAFGVTANPFFVVNSGTFAVQLTGTTNTVQGTGASGAALAGNPFRVGLSDGTNSQNWLAAIALADGVNGNNTGAVASWLWNGTTYDRAKGDLTNGAYVNVKTSVLPTGAATLAKQPALGTAGTASTDVLSVQGISSMTPLLTTSTGAAGTARIGYTSDDPCTQKAKTNLPISQNGTSSVQLVALSGATVIYVCSISLVAAGATTVALTTGTGSACVTGNAAVIGTTTASIANSMSFVANGGMTLGNGGATIAQGAASSELCMVLGTNVFVSGNLTYVQQ